MSLLRYFKRKDPASKGIFVPVANDGATASANVCVSDLASEPPCKRSKTHQHSYDAKTRAQIGEYTYIQQWSGSRRSPYFYVAWAPHPRVYDEEVSRCVRNGAEKATQLRQQCSTCSMLCKRFLLSPEEEH